MAEYPLDMLVGKAMTLSTRYECRRGRQRDLFPAIANFQALTAAAQTAARGKRRTGLRQRWQTGGVERVEVI